MSNRCWKERKQHKPHTRTHDEEKMKSANKASIFNTEAKSIKLGLTEMESNMVSIADDDEWC